MFSEKIGLKTKKYYRILIFIIGLTLFSYSSYRASQLSMTHDESVSYLWFEKTNVFRCLFSKECWPNANNHLLNTYLFQRTVSLLGENEIGIRLPNLLAHILYMVCSIIFIRLISQNPWVIITGFLMLNLNTYLLDYFSLARGYGLSAAFAMLGMVSLSKYLQNYKYFWLIITYSALLFAILSNFVALNTFLSIWGASQVFNLIQLGRRKVKWKRIVIENIIPLVFAGFIYALINKPIGFLKHSGEFLFGSSRFEGTFISVVQNSLYNAAYFGKETVFIFSLMYGIVMFFCLLLGFYSYFKDKHLGGNKYYLFSVLVFLVACIIMVLQHEIIGSNYLQDRKALFFIPLSGMVAIGALNWLIEKLKIGYPLVILIIVFTCHFFRTFNFTHTLEWNYDKDTKAMVSYLKGISKPESNELLHLGVDWTFQPTTLFYFRKMKISNFELPPFHSDIITDGRFDYYYLYERDLNKLDSTYEIEKKIAFDKFLLKKR